MEIREATEKDLPQVFELIREFSRFMNNPEKVSVTLKDLIRDKKLFGCMIACEGEEILGYGIYFFGYYSWTGKSLYIDDLYVKENFRGKKTGTKLLQKIIETAKAVNCTKVRWQVSVWNERAIAFYKKQGAMIDDIERNCDIILTESKFLR